MLVNPMLHIRRAGLKPPRSSATPAEAGFLCAESICLIQKIANLVLDTGFSKRLPCTGVTHGLIRLASDCNRWRNIVLYLRCFRQLDRQGCSGYTALNSLT